MDDFLYMDTSLISHTVPWLQFAQLPGLPAQDGSVGRWEAVDTSNDGRQTHHDIQQLYVKLVLSTNK